MVHQHDYWSYVNAVYRLLVSAGGSNGKSMDQLENDVVDAWMQHATPHECVQRIRKAYPFQNRNGLIDQTETYGYDTACSDEVNMLVDCALAGTNPEFIEDGDNWLRNNHDIAINGGIVFG